MERTDCKNNFMLSKPKRLNLKNFELGEIVGTGKFTY